GRSLRASRGFAAVEQFVERKPIIAAPIERVRPRMQRRVVGHGAWRCDDDDVAARRRPEELGRGEGAANAVDVRTLFAARDQIEERGAARLEALVQAAVE